MFDFGTRSLYIRGTNLVQGMYTYAPMYANSTPGNMILAGDPIISVLPCGPNGPPWRYSDVWIVSYVYVPTTLPFNFYRSNVSVFTDYTAGSPNIVNVTQDPNFYLYFILT